MLAGSGVMAPVSTFTIDPFAAPGTIDVVTGGEMGWAGPPCVAGA
jgi:hypothetical protein